MINKNTKRKNLIKNRQNPCDCIYIYIYIYIYGYLIMLPLMKG